MNTSLILLSALLGCGEPAPADTSVADTGADTSSVTEPVCVSYFVDQDRDGFGDRGQNELICDAESTDGYSLIDGDCDDSDKAINPDATEVCNAIDDDCDGATDRDDDSLDLSTAKEVFYDGDGDGFGSEAKTVCLVQGDYVEQDGDCDDSNGDVHPGADELCDGADDDCDGGVDGTAVSPNQCSAYAGYYFGGYAITAEEKLGNSVINSMKCKNGSSAIMINLNSSPTVSGTAKCTFSGGLGAFLTEQTATIEGDVLADGTIKGTLVHTFRSGGIITGTFNFTGSVSAPDAFTTELSVTDSGRWSPSSMSAIPWYVDYQLDGLSN